MKIIKQNEDKILLVDSKGQEFTISESITGKGLRVQINGYNGDFVVKPLKSNVILLMTTK